MTTQWMLPTSSSAPTVDSPLGERSPGEVKALARDDRPAAMPLDRIDRNVPGRLRDHMAETSYPSNRDCEPPNSRDDVAAEASNVARIATARAMNFVRSDVGSAAVRGAGDGYLDVVREYVNSALAQRCNPLRIHHVGSALRGVDSLGDGLSISGDASRTKISITRHGVNEPNRMFITDHNGLTKNQVRKIDGSYAPLESFNSPGANYLMRYHHQLSTDGSMVP